MNCSKVYGDDEKAEVTGVGGLSNIIYPFGEQAVGAKHDDVSVQFQYNYLDTQFDVNTGVTGVGATVGVDDSVAYAETLTAGEMAYISSIDSIRYRAGHSGFILFTMGGDLTNGGHVHGGGFDPDMSNGFIVEINETGSGLHFGFLKNGVEKGSNYIDGLDEVKDHGLTLANLNIYFIMFGYLGVASPSLFVRINGNWKHLHTVDTEGLSPFTHTSTPVFPVTIMSHDGAKAITGSWNGGVVANGSVTGSRPFAFPNQIVVNGTAAEQSEMLLSGTNVGTIVIFNSKDTFHGKTNNVKAKLTGFSFDVDIPPGTNVFGEVLFQLVGVQTLSGTPTYTDVNTNSSVIRYDHVNGAGATVNVTAGVPIISKIVNYVSAKSGGSISDASIDPDQIGAFAYGGNTFAIIAKDLSGNNITVRAYLNWSELF